MSKLIDRRFGKIDGAIYMFFISAGTVDYTGGADVIPNT